MHFVFKSSITAFLQGALDKLANGTSGWPQWRYGQHAGLRNCSKQVWAPVTLLCSLFPWENMNPIIQKLWIN